MSAHLLDAADYTDHYEAKHPPDVQVSSSSVNDFLHFLEAKTETCKPHRTKRNPNLHTENLSFSLLWEQQPGLMLSFFII
jgi:hypothetical protein